MCRLIFLSLVFINIGFSLSAQQENVLKDPPIYGLYTSENLTISRGQTAILNEGFLIHPGVTTEEGEKFFTKEVDGLRVNQPGFYRVSFFQKINTLDEISQIYIYFDRVYSGGYLRLRTQEINLGIRDGIESQFVQIVRMNAGDKFKVTAVGFKGEATLLRGYSHSGFIVEPINR